MGEYKTVCNMCGREFDIWDTQEDFTIERDCGYGTEYDGCYVKLHLCCECFESLVSKCVVSPVVNPE